MNRPGLSVVIPTFNRGESLRITLESILAQQTDVPFEVIVVDNNSSDATPGIARSYASVRYVFEGRQGLCFARNAGIVAAEGDVIVFVDDDIIAPPNWLGRINAVYLERPDAWCVGGKIVLKFAASPPDWFSLRELSGYLSGLDRGDMTSRLSYPDDVWGANFSVSRLALARVGCFRTDLDRSGRYLLSGGDTELCWRIHHAGGGVYYCGQAVIAHLVPQSRMTRAYFRHRAYWEGRTSRLLGQKRPPLKWILLILAWQQARAALGRPLNPARAFSDTLEAWKYLGYIRQCAILELQLLLGKRNNEPERRLCPPA
jgi:glycosyltransferase involved in cell wall biosynthesis